MYIKKYLKNLDFLKDLVNPNLIRKKSNPETDTNSKQLTRPEPNHGSDFLFRYTQISDVSG